MAPRTRTTIRAGSGTWLDAATLLLAGFTALVVIARSDAGPRHGPVGPRDASPAVAARPAPQAEADDAEWQATLRDMLLHD